jgi:hypothetical protein
VENVKIKSTSMSYMATLDEFSKGSLDKIIDNVVSCLPLIENMFMDQNNEFRNEIGIENRRDFILGSVWCIILEKYIIANYLHSGKTINYENGLEVSRYVLDRISKSDLLMSTKNV